MGIESSFATIQDLNVLWPLGSDSKSTADDHLRGIKTSLLGTFPYVDGTTSGPMRAGANNRATCSGTNTITFGLTPALASYVEGQVFDLEMGGSPNTGPVTLNGDSNGAGALVWPDGTAFSGGELPAGGYFRAVVADAVTPIFHLLSAVGPTMFQRATALVGEVKMYAGTAAPTYYLEANGGTIGDGSSGGTARANADTETLFSLLWNGTANADLPIQDSAGVASTRGANAAADFAAHKRLPLPDFRDYFPRGKSGSRANLSAQDFATQDHDHYVNQGSDLASVAVYNALAPSTNVMAGGNNAGTAGSPLSIGPMLENTEGGTLKTATETRPKNIALMFIIRYKAA